MQARALFAIGLAVGAACAHAQTAELASRPGSALERDTMPRLSEQRLSKRSAAEQKLWHAYIARSHARLEADRAFIADELRAAGKTKWVPAPYIAAFGVQANWRSDWFASADAQHLADNLLAWQTPAGGWSKHVDMASHPRAAGESYFSENDQWQWIGTFDNDATITQLYLLGNVNRVRPDARYRRAFDRGLDYVLQAQYPNGCWPQVYPLQGGYHDNATFNDDNVAEIGAFLRDVSVGKYPFVSAQKRAESETAVGQLVDCVITAQVIVNGKRTVWGQQHDALTLEPTSARSYELPSLTGKESAHLVDFLMELPSPDARVVRAIHAAADWFKHNEVRGFAYRDYKLTVDSTAGPLWARMAEIGTNRPMFFNRDGVKHYDWDALTDRRTGYAWFSDAPIATLAQYEVWARAHPQKFPLKESHR